MFNQEVLIHFEGKVAHLNSITCNRLKLAFCNQGCAFALEGKNPNKNVAKFTRTLKAQARNLACSRWRFCACRL